MTDDDDLRAALDKAWKSTCKAVLKDEIGDLKDYVDYLKKYTDPVEYRRSFLSEKEVSISSGRFGSDARFLDNGESEQYNGKFAATPLDVNSIKDMDSVTDAISERACYAGNIVLGNSAHVARSHRVVNTNYALECQDIYDGKYVAYASSMRYPEYFFGGGVGSASQFCIKTQENYKMARCMETIHMNITSDCYFCASLENCSDCMFSFNQKQKRFMIGNLQLQKDDYAALKDKLIAEIRETLQRDKSVISIAEIMGGKRG